MLLQRVKISKNAENGFVEKRFKIFFLYLTGQNPVLDRLCLGKTANKFAFALGLCYLWLRLR